MYRATHARLAALGLALTLCLGCSAAAAQDEQAPPTDSPDAADASAANDAEPAIDPQVEALLDRIEAAAAQTQTLKADLRYDRVQGLLGDEQRRFGELRYAAGTPAKFAAHFDKLLVDGKARRIDLGYTFDGVWLAERNGEDKTFVRRQLVPEDEAGQPMELGHSPFVLPLDARKADIVARFHIALADPADSDPKDTVHLILTPRDSRRMAQKQIDLWYDAESMRPVRISSLDESQNLSVIDLMKVQVNKPLGDKTFDTTPPTGGGWSVQVHPLAEDDDASADADATDE